MEFKSEELINASMVPPDTITADAPAVTEQHIKQQIVDFFGRKNFTLIKSFEHEMLLTNSALNTNELLCSVLKCMRNHFISLYDSTETTYTQHVAIINKVFDNIISLVELINTINIKSDKNKLAASLLGNIIKHII
jgi:acetolactate synthase small subunit